MNTIGYPKMLAISLRVSAITALAISACVTLWEWVENPSGIFHDDSSTQWQFVWDTAISWLLPTFGYLLIITLLAQLLWRGISKLLARYK
jgi:N6-adenosine-specific RNA methylase IME4